MLVMVVDGKGGGIGVSLIEKILECNLDVDIIGIGTNSVAMSGMNKLGVDCASGENPVVYNAGRADFILGPMGILTANSMFGEITPKMAYAISESEAKKILIPMNKCNVITVGVINKRINEYIEEAIDILKEEIEKKKSR
ncbi:DUF3842 family protein [Anaerofustis stercorihominis]|uniref:DUF3842 family protein n=1 Tax=Anaerofustis stercorihominis TaxID=214853 RepID=UPI002673ADDF|nr:DUF3842 family protein [Anaerofustis stercorihominis]